MQYIQPIHRPLSAHGQQLPARLQRLRPGAPQTLHVVFHRTTHPPRPLPQSARHPTIQISVSVPFEQGHPIRTTISEMGPLLLARLLDLNDTQEGVLQIVFKHADENGLLLLDFGDLQAMLQWAHENSQELSGVYGNVSKR